MIQINPTDLEDITKQHLLHVEPMVLKRIRFYRDFFDRIANGKKVKFDKSKKESVAIKYNMAASTIKMLVEPFLKKDYRKKEKYNLTIDGIQLLLSKSSLSPIDHSKKRNSYRKLISLIIEIEKDIKELLVAKPKRLSELKDKAIYSNLSEWELFVIIKILSYEDLSKKGFKNISNGVSTIWGSYTLTNRIKANSCVYCNRNWVTTIGSQDEKVTNPQLDHYFSKGDFPILRLAFYNLIPSCETCNSRIKKKVEFIYDLNLHPYEEGYANMANFRAFAMDSQSIDGNADNFEIFLEYNEFISSKLKTKISNNHELFQIDEIYKNHGDIISEIYLRRRLFSEAYLKTLKDNIEFGETATFADLYKIAFGNYFYNNEHPKRPFSKLTKDIIEQLEFVL